MTLSALQKLAWFYVLERCDSCGVWDRNDRLANCQIGSHINWDEALKAFGKGRVCVLPEGKWFIRAFARFQYGRLTATSLPHKRVIEKSESHGLTLLSGVLTTPQEEEKEEGKEGREFEGTSPVSERIDANLVQEQGGDLFAPKRPTLEILLLHGSKIGLPDAEVHKFWNHYESNGWKVGKNPMKSYVHSMSNWKINWEERRHENPRTSNAQRVDRNVGTCNEGNHTKYGNLGKVVTPPNTQ